MYVASLKAARCAIIVAMLALATIVSARAQLAPLPSGQGGWGAPGGQPSLPPLNPNSRDLSGYWKSVIPIAPNGNYVGAAFIPPSMVARTECIPNFPLFSSVEGAAQFVQTPKLLMIIFEEDHRVRLIRLNGTHPANLVPSHWGDSIGHWEGDTLVVNTTGVKGQVETGGPMVSPRMIVTERIRKIDGGAALEDRMSFADPAGEKLPAPLIVRLNWSAPQKIMEWICEDNGQIFWGKKSK